MPLTDEKHFICGLQDCKVDFYYDPGSQGKPPNWPAAIQVALTKVIAIVMPLTGHTAFFCCKEHAIEALEKDQYLPEMPKKVAGATEADLEAAKRGMKIVENMKGATARGSA